MAPQTAIHNLRRRSEVGAQDGRAHLPKKLNRPHGPGGPEHRSMHNGHSGHTHGAPQALLDSGHPLLQDARAAAATNLLFNAEVPEGLQTESPGLRRSAKFTAAHDVV